MNLDTLSKRCSEICESELGIKPWESRFIIHDNWYDFVVNSGIDSMALGVYLLGKFISSFRW